MASPAHIYLFTGPDSFSIAEKISYWKKRFTEKYGTSGISVFDCEEGADDSATLSALKSSLSSQSLFSATTLVIVKNLWSKKVSAIHDALASSLPTLSPHIFLVLASEVRDTKSELSKMLAALEKSGACSIEEFHIPEGPSLKKWIADRAQKLNHAFDRDALAIFCNALEERQTKSEDDVPRLSLWHLDNEIRKLASHASSSAIGVPDVRAVACLPVSGHVFDLSDALLSGNEQRALFHAHSILGPFSQGTRTAASAALLRSLGFLLTQFRSFLVLKNMEEDHQSEQTIAAALLWNPKRVWVVRKKLTARSTKQLTTAYRGLLDLEQRIKTGSADPLLALDLTIHSLCNQ